MKKLNLKFFTAIIALALAGCGGAEEPAFRTPSDFNLEGELEPYIDPEDVELDISDEAFVDIMANSRFLSITLSAEYIDRTESAMHLAYMRKMKEVAARHGLDYEEIDFRHFEKYLIANTELREKMEEKMRELWDDYEYSPAEE